MGYRTIKSANKVFVLRNTTAQTLSVSGATVLPGKSREVAAWVFMQDKFRSGELAALMAKGKLTVSLDGMPMSVEAISGLEAPIAVAATRVAQFPTANLPAPADVPVGTVVFDTTLATLVTNDGAAWV